MYGYDSNEPVKGMTPWVSPVVVVPKKMMKFSFVWTCIEPM